MEEGQGKGYFLLVSSPLHPVGWLFVSFRVR